MEGIHPHDPLPGYASAICCGPVYLSVTSWSSTKTAKSRTSQTMLRNSPGTLVFWYQGCS